MHHMSGLHVCAPAGCGQEEGGQFLQLSRTSVGTSSQGQRWCHRIRPTEDQAGSFQCSGKLLIHIYLVLFQDSFFCFYLLYFSSFFNLIFFSCLSYFGIKRKTFFSKHMKNLLRNHKPIFLYFLFLGAG